MERCYVRQLKDVASGKEHSVAKQKLVVCVVHRGTVEQPWKLKVHRVDLVQDNGNVFLHWVAEHLVGCSILGRLPVLRVHTLSDVNIAEHAAKACLGASWLVVLFEHQQLEHHAYFEEVFAAIVLQHELEAFGIAAC